jgi:60 kDa SS-A/Ro ribonucleoprotein
MANKNLFRSIAGKLIPKATSVNEAGGKAYALTPKQALAQFASTGCLSQTFYASADDQLAKVLELCEGVEPAFIAQTALWARRRGYMKDMPAVLCAVLATKDTSLLEQVFPLVIDNGRMLRNFVQVVRSGVVGRKSLGTAPKRMIRKWLEGRDDNALFRDSIGNAPSLADVIKMVHPKPAAAGREALYGYLIGRKHEAEKLPSIVREYEAFKEGVTKDVPDVPFQMLTSLTLDNRAWATIARNASWQTTRMNLNTFARHGVFADATLTKEIARRLADAEAVRKAKVFPYQLMTAYLAADENVPAVVRDALHDAMEVATENVPAIEGKVYICPDVSGSMRSPLTGVRKGATSVVRCVDVAALVAASIVRKNPSAEVLPFETDVVNVRIERRDSVMTNAQKLAAVGGGGTTCSAPLAKLNQQKATGELVVFVSDNESWADPQNGRGTAMMKEWSTFKDRNPGARLVCIDVQPYATTQAQSREDVLNIGGFSDAVFDVVAQFAAGKLDADLFVNEIEKGPNAVADYI